MSFSSSHFFAGAKQITKPDVNPKNDDYDSHHTKASTIDKVFANSEPIPICDKTENILAHPKKRTGSNNRSPDSKVMACMMITVIKPICYCDVFRFIFFFL